MGALKGEAHAWLESAVCDPGDDCIIWPFMRQKGPRGGHAYIREPGTRRHVGAYRMAWEMFHRKLWPEGFEARHSCGNGHHGCVNPLHITPGTHAENMREMVLHGRWKPPGVRGSCHGMAKMTEKDVREICGRLATGETQKAVAADYGVCRATISFIWNGTTWGHVDAPRKNQF